MRTSTRLVIFPAAVAVLLLSATVMAETLVTLDQPEPYELQAIGFQLDRQAEVRIDALGMDSRHDRGFELNFWGRGDDEDELEVYSWIIDADSREPVWVMRRQGSDRESGSLRSIEKRLTLEPGRYEVYLFSGLTWLAQAREDERKGHRRSRDDDSWWERMFVGKKWDLDEIERDLRDCKVTVSLSTGGQAAEDLKRDDVPRFEVTGELPGALIREAQVGDSEFRVRGFELDKPMQLRIRALLEGERDGEEAADYGFIVDAETRELTWQAELKRSDRAGGGRKNRLVDVERTFQRGRYLLYYGTDDSHSFDEFNVNPPYDPLNWGIAVFPGGEFDPQAFRTFVPGPLPEPLIDFSRAGDDFNRQQAFRLHKGGDLHVTALGEYTDDFADLGWITDASGRTVWEMTKSNTRGAGGSAKNRMFDGLVSLSAGDYILYYSSDDSHSYDEFNAAKPFEPQSWGVTLRPGPGFAPLDLQLIEASALAQTGEVIARLIGVGDDDRQRQRFTLDRDSVLRIYALGEGRNGRMYDYGWIVDDATGKTVWEMEYDDTQRAGGAAKNRRFEGEVRLPAGTYELVYETDGSHSFDEWNAAGPRDPLNWGITLRRD